MEIFFVFALIFVPVIWYLIRALRYTDQTVGEHSPLKTVITYRVTAREFFAQPGFIGYVLLSLFTLSIPFVLMAHLNATVSPWAYVLTMFTTGVMGYFGYSLYRLVRLHEHYWQLSKGVTITLDPATKTISVDRNGCRTQLNAETVSRIEHHFTSLAGPDIFKGYNYYEFIGVENTVTVLNGRPSFLYYAVDAYFTNTPRINHSYKIPWPPEQHLTPSPNFANNVSRY